MFIKNKFPNTLITVTISSLILGLFISPLVSPVLAATPRCGAHNDIVKALEKKYGETVRGVGFVADKGLMQVLVSPEKGTWTIIMTNPKGQSCLIAAGKGWEELKQKAKENEA